MSDWYHPGIPFTAETADLLRKWAGDHGIEEECLSILTREELEAAIQALQMLAYWHWLSAPIKSDLLNPFWLENEGCNEADREMQVLRGLEEKLRDHGPIMACFLQAEEEPDLTFDHRLARGPFTKS